jgi:hypothetical protein
MPKDPARKRAHRSERPWGVRLLRWAVPFLVAGGAASAVWPEPARPWPAVAPFALAALIVVEIRVRRPRRAARKLRTCCHELLAELPAVEITATGLPVPGGRSAGTHVERIIERPRNIRLALEDLLVLARSRDGGLTEQQWERLIDALKAALGRYERGAWPQQALVQRPPRGRDQPLGMQLLPRQPRAAEREIDLRSPSTNPTPLRELN